MTISRSKLLSRRIRNKESEDAEIFIKRGKACLLYTSELKKNYNAWDYYNGDERLKKAIDSLVDGTWAADHDEFKLIFDELMYKNDEYLLLADFDSYVRAHEEIQRRYGNRGQWAKSCLINIAKSGYFSSDRTIQQYADEIWHIKPVRIDDK